MWPFHFVTFVTRQSNKATSVTSHHTNLQKKILLLLYIKNILEEYKHPRQHLHSSRMSFSQLTYGTQKKEIYKLHVSTLTCNNMKTHHQSKFNIKNNLIYQNVLFIKDVSWKTCTTSFHRTKGPCVKCITKLYKVLLGNKFYEIYSQNSSYLSIVSTLSFKALLWKYVSNTNMLSNHWKYLWTMAVVLFQLYHTG